jgi:CubicO group peptidase (beta-lactamase class C family)
VAVKSCPPRHARLVAGQILAVVAASRATPGAQAARPVGSLAAAALDRAITAQTAKHGLPGAALAVVQGDAIVYLQGYGPAGSRARLTPQAQVFIGSQSKSCTALAIAQLPKPDSRTAPGGRQP